MSTDGTAPQQDQTSTDHDATANGPTGPTARNGWDGKLRVNKQATLVNPEALEDPDYSDEDAPPPDEIAADESEPNQSDTEHSSKSLTTKTDLLDDEDTDTEVLVLSDPA